MIRDREAGKPGQPGVGSPQKKAGNRPRIVLQGLREYLQHRESLLRDERKRKVGATFRRLVARQAEALIGEQAEP